MKKGLIIVLLAIMALVFSQSAFALTKTFNITVTVSTLNMDLRNHDDTDGYPGWDIIVGLAQAITMLENDIVKVVANSAGNYITACITTRINNPAGWTSVGNTSPEGDQFALLAQGFWSKPNSPDPNHPIVMSNPKIITPGTMEPLHWMDGFGQAEAWLSYAFYAPLTDSTNQPQNIEVGVDVTFMP